MNIRLLKKIRSAILKRPRQFEMNWYFQEDLQINGKDVPAGGCGTAACIAGWAIHESAKNKKLSTTRTNTRTGDAWRKGAQLLKIDYPLSERLFQHPRWPFEFYKPYLSAKTPLARAKVAAARISHFIKTKGAE